jgi:hypothetical protein
LAIVIRATWTSSPEGAPEELVVPLSALGHSVRVLSHAQGTLHAEVLGVPVSVLRYGYALLKPPQTLAGFVLPLASADDLVCMKLSAIANRGARRDFWDLHALLENQGLSLEQALGLYQRKYPVEDIGHVVRSLVYFADADSEPMPAGLSAQQWRQIKAAFENRVAQLP